MTNIERARRARRALSTYTREVHDGAPAPTLCRADRETALADLICDLMHYAHWEEFDFGRALNRGQYHFDIESRYGWNAEVTE